jgi:hypothetical protein
MKILFVGPYRQPDEWGEKSRNIIKSIMQIDGISLTTRPLFLSSVVLNQNGFDPKILACEANKQKQYDVVIQHCLPTFMIQDGNFKTNIGITSIETKGNDQWSNNLELMDSIFVLTQAEKDCVPEHLQERVHVIGGCIDAVEQDSSPPNPRFSFYCLAGHLETKSGVLPLLQAFMSEFHLNEAVTLVLQTGNIQLAQQMVKETAQTLGMYGESMYPHIHIVETNEEDSVHKNCQCLVDTSVTRGFKTDVAKALCYGNTPIVLQGSGMDEYVNSDNGWVVNSSESILVCPDRPLVNVFTGNETCIIPDKVDLKKCMREAFDSRGFLSEKSNNARKSYEMFSNKKQAEAIKEILKI